MRDEDGSVQGERWEAGSLSVGRIQQQTLEQRWGKMALTGHVARPLSACETLLHWLAAGRLLSKG